MQELERYDLVETVGSGPHQQRRAKDVGKLLDKWAEERSKRKPTISNWYLPSPTGPLVKSLVSKINSQNIVDVLVTGAAAANTLAPTLTSVPTAELIVPKGLTDDVVTKLGLKEAVRGYNIQIVERNRASLLFPMREPFYEQRYFASPFIQYLDLLNGAGRNKELAEALRKDILRV
jgi:hypothetical protein